MELRFDAVQKRVRITRKLMLCIFGGFQYFCPIHVHCKFPSLIYSIYVEELMLIADERLYSCAFLRLFCCVENLRIEVIFFKITSVFEFSLMVSVTKNILRKKKIIIENLTTVNNPNFHKLVGFDKNRAEKSHKARALYFYRRVKNENTVLVLFYLCRIRVMVVRDSTQRRTSQKRSTFFEQKQ